jgi:GntR family transcriptional regulator, rspAB operon transcriptional repressor
VGYENDVGRYVAILCHAKEWQKTNPMRDGFTKNIYESMVRRIVVGDFAQGEILTDVGLASLFSTSRTPVREACIYLVKEGFLQRAPGRGYIVTATSLDDARELYQLRLILEPPAAELAAGASLPKNFFLTCSKLVEQITQTWNETLSAERSYERFLALGKAEYGFHCEIAEASGSKRLAKTIRELMNQFRRFHYIGSRRSPYQATGNEEHMEIVEAIRRQDAPEARRLMYEHILNGSQRALQLVLSSLPGREPKPEGTLANFRTTAGSSSGVA